MTISNNMKKLILAGFSAATFLSLGANSAVAGPIGDTACTQPASSGFGTLVNCGTYIDTIAGGNDAGGPLAVGGVNYTQLGKWNDGTGWETSGPPNFTVTGLPSGFPSDNGTWTAASPIMFLVIKAGGGGQSGGGYSVYGQGSLSSGSIGTVNNSLADVTAIFSGLTSGAWATAPTILNNQDEGREISHISFYGAGDPSIPFIPVPEPGAFSLLGLGLLSLGLSRRRLRA